MKPNPLDPTLRDLNNCGCCVGTATETPAAIVNRPALPAVTFRSGTHARFKASLLAALSNANRPELGKLRTREDDDFTIALLDGFAAMADVLTFYSERIANESFLRTATERRSVFELARAIGYELNPGVAASAWLAFTIEGAPGSPGTASIPQGTKIQSIPGPDEKPQTYETSTDFIAHAGWNEFRLKSTKAQESRTDLPSLYLKGTNTNLKAGDVMLISVGDSVVVKRVQLVLPDVERDWTWIDFALPTELTTVPTRPTTITGYMTPSPSITVPVASASISQMVTTVFAGQVSVGSSLGRSLIHYSGFAPDEVREHYTQPAPVPALTPLNGVFAFRTRAGFFGHNAPRWRSLPPDNRRADSPRAGYAQDWDALTASGEPTTIWQDSQGTLYNSLSIADTSDVYLERLVSAITPLSWVVLDRGAKTLTPYRVSVVTEKSLADYSLSGRCTGLALRKADGTALETPRPDSFGNRTTTAYVQSERLELAELTITTNLQGVSELPLDRLDFDLVIGQSLLLTGERLDLSGVQAVERIVIESVNYGDGVTQLRLLHPLERGYIRHSVRIYANVVEATHGESVKEVLGNGDATRAHQQFTLRQKPLTYVLPPGGDGAESSLQLWVNDTKWREVSSLYHQPAQAKVFVARLQDDGTTVITVGNSEQGARLPSGVENVRAIYRKGIGADGLVKANQLTLLVTRPLGVKAVTNPLKPTGAENPETNARRRAPLHTLTLGRIVSLQDYEDFARAFPGVAKAQAVWAWTSHGRGIALTVIGPDGVEINQSGQPADALRSAIQNKGDDRVPMRLLSQAPTIVGLAAQILAAPDRLLTRVEAEVKAALLKAFSFEARDLGQGIYLSEVLEVIHRVPGVIAVTHIVIGKISLTNGELTLVESSHGSLPAFKPSNGTALKVAQPAELVIMDEFSFTQLEFILQTP